MEIKLQQSTMLHKSQKYKKHGWIQGFPYEGNPTSYFLQFFRGAIPLGSANKEGYFLGVCLSSGGSRISHGGANLLFCIIFAETCMKMEKIGLGVHVSHASKIRHC